MSNDYKMEQKYDLEKFINTEIKSYSNGDIILPRIFKYYYKCQIRIIFEIYEKLIDIEDLNIYETLQYGTNMVSHIFWCLYSYSLNIKLTMFLTERAVLLFTEFIVMSKNPLLNKEFRFMPSVCDAMAFSIKKTIGPLQNKCNTKNKKFLKDLNRYKLISINMKYLIQQLLYSIIINKTHTKSEVDKQEYKSKYINNNEDIISFLELVSSGFCQTICNLDDSICFNIFVKFFNNVNEDLTLKICMCKLYLDIFTEINPIIDDSNVSESIIEDYLYSVDLDKEEFNISNLKFFKKKIYFKKILKEIKNII